MINDFDDFKAKYCIHTGYRLLVSPKGYQLLVNDYRSSKHRQGRPHNIHQEHHKHSKKNVSDRELIRVLKNEVTHDNQQIATQNETISMLNHNLDRAQKNMTMAQELQVTSQNTVKQRNQKLLKLQRLYKLPSNNQESNSQKAKPKKKGIFSKIFGR